MITVSAWQLVVVEDVVCLRRSESPATFGFINRVSRESGNDTSEKQRVKNTS